MKFMKVFVAAAATAMLAAAPVAAQNQENGSDHRKVAIAAVFALSVFGAFILFDGNEDVRPTSP